LDKACAKIDPATWGGSYVTLRNPKTGDWSMIVCADKPVTLLVQVAGKLAKGDVHVWKSNEKIQFVEVPKEGIAWGGPGGVPNTVFGDKLWTDYTIQADVLVTGGKVGLGGRFTYGQFLGWDFALAADGTWSVQAPHVANGQESVKSLATGKITDFTPGQWHHLAASLKGEDMLVTVDGKEVTRVKYEGYLKRKNGMAYLLSRYDPNCFDNLSVTP